MPEHFPRPETPESALEKRLNLRAQYAVALKSLNETGVLEILPDKDALGIAGIDGVEYPLPSYESIKTKLLESEAWLSEKLDQGFTELTLVPIAMPIATLAKRVERELKVKHKEGELTSPGNPPTSLELDTENPLYLWDQFKGADESGELKYFPKQFSKDNHHGLTKQELITQTNDTSFPGFIVTLSEPTEIPSQGKGKTLAGRPQLETNHTPNDYLETLENPRYAHEQGETIEGWMARLLRHLHEKGEVIDDYQGTGKLNYLTGNYHPASGYVPVGGWYRVSRQTGVYRSTPGDRSDRDGSRSAVRVGLDFGD